VTSTDLPAETASARTAAPIIAWAAAAAALALAGIALWAEIVGVRAGVPPDERDWVLAGLCSTIGARVVSHARRNPCGWLILGTGFLAAVTLGASIPATGPMPWLRDWSWWPGYGLLILAALLFPDGHAPSTRWRWVTAGMATAITAGTVALASLGLRAPRTLLTGDRVLSPGWDTAVFLLATVAMLVGAVLAMIALVKRIRRAPPSVRGAFAWAACNTGLLVVAIVLDAAVGLPVVWLGTALAIPAATAIGVVRYGLYDIGLLIHRSLLYGLLTVAVIAVYAGTVAATTSVAGPATAPVAAVVAVMALLPLRQGVQGMLARLLYGQGARPYEMVVMLGRRIGLAHTPDEILTVAVSTIGEGLKVPYAAVYLTGRGEPESTHGRERPWPSTTLTLAYRGRQIGRLLVQQRSPDEPWSRRERALLRALAEQLGPSAAVVALTRELQAARERLVRAREEELRRLQRDLHDGIGPALTAARMLAKAAYIRTAEDALKQLEADLADAAGDLRQIVDGLRPPALDRGLAAALDTAVRRHQWAGLTVNLTITGDVRDLPAAVEVATYRVVDEALNNVVKHAGAAHAAVAVNRTADTLHLQIDDDGTGPADPRTGGVGLESMRGRCQELGGTLHFVPLTPGSRIVATLPLS
jgi:signal transduction histidine kinase